MPFRTVVILDQSLDGERIARDRFTFGRGGWPTDWKAIVSHYDTLLKIRPSPVVALNRAIAVGQHEGSERGLEEIQSIANCDRLAAYPFYHAALGEFEFRKGTYQGAREHFEKAHSLARSPLERQFIKQRIAACESRAPQRVR